MRECIFYIGTIEAEDRTQREKGLGYEVHYLDSGVDPADYNDWDVYGLSVLVYCLEDASPEYVEKLAAVLDQEGAASTLIFDRDGNYLFRKTPFTRVDDPQEDDAA